MVFTRKNPPSKYYVYAYIRASDSTPYYIGKGKGIRAWDINHNATRPNDQSKIIILEHGLSETESLLLEQTLITKYGRKDNGTGILYNRTDGGEGSSGFIHSDESRKKISESKKGKKLSPSTSIVRSVVQQGEKNSFYGRTHSDETRAKIAASRIGKKASAETRKKMSAAHLGQIPWNKGAKNIDY